MESEGPPKPEEKILHAIDAADPAEASEVLARLTAELHAHGVHGVNLTGLWNSFKRLLHRRGYFVSTPAQLATSLDEIATVGEGFDLFELARHLARYDAVRMECRGLADYRVFPELRRFAPSCACRSKREDP